MGLQWNIAAGILYTEIFVLLLLCLPFVSYSRWHKIFRSRVMSAIRSYGNQLFIICVAFLFILLLDSVREIMKDPVKRSQGSDKIQDNLMMQIKLHRAQRNYYITGFALLSIFFLRRIMGLMSSAAVVEASKEAAIKQAENASEQCKKLMDENKELTEKLESTGTSSNSGESNSLYKELQSELEETRQELERHKINLATLKQQAEGTNREYDRLLAEHTKLQAKVDGDGNRNKDD